MQFKTEHKPLPGGQKWFMDLLDLLGYTYYQNNAGYCHGVMGTALISIYIEDDGQGDSLKRLNDTLDNVNAWHERLKSINLRQKNGLSSQNITHEKNELKKEIQDNSDAMAFFDNVAIHQNLYYFPELQQYVSKQNLSLSLSLVVRDSKLERISNLSQPFTKESLTNDFLSLHDEFEKYPLKYPISFPLYDTSHALLLVYYPANKSLVPWLCINANTLNEQHLESSLIGTKLFSHFGSINKEYTYLATDIYAHQNEAKLVSQIVDNWLASRQQLNKDLYMTYADKPDSSGTSWLHMAARTNDHYSIQGILSNTNANPDLVYIWKTKEDDLEIENTCTPLGSALLGRNYEAIEALCPFADINKPCINSKLPLELAISIHDVRSLEIILDKYKFDLKTKQGCELLNQVIKIGDLSIIECLYSRGADLLSGGRGITTPLHQAVESGHVPIIQFLLAHGANPFQPFGRYKITAMMKAQADNEVYDIMYACLSDDQKVIENNTILERLRSNLNLYSESPETSSMKTGVNLIIESILGLPECERNYEAAFHAIRKEVETIKKSRKEEIFFQKEDQAVYLCNLILGFIPANIPANNPSTIQPPQNNL